MVDPTKIVADANAVKAWYASHLFYSGAIVGAFIGGVVAHWLHL